MSWTIVDNGKDEQPVGSAKVEAGRPFEYRGKRYTKQRKRSRGQVFATSLDGGLLSDSILLHPSTPVKPLELVWTD